jgi:hypothetical protein
MVGYMADPISLASVGLSPAVTTARTLKAIGQTAIKLGATEMALEAAIQPFVMNYKNEIDSEYGYEDAITNILTAGAGSALLGAAGKGLSDLLDDVAQKSVQKGIPPELVEELTRVRRLLANNPLRKDGKDNFEADVEALRALEEARINPPKPMIDEISTPRVEGQLQVRRNLLQPVGSDSQFKMEGDVTSLEQVVLNKAGLYADYEQIILAFKQLQEEMPPEILDEWVDEYGATLKTKMDEAQFELDGLELINKCLLS